MKLKELFKLCDDDQGVILDLDGAEVSGTVEDIQSLIDDSFFDTKVCTIRTEDDNLRVWAEGNE